MKIITLLGSPRPNGNTATVLKKFEEFAAYKHTIRRYNLNDAHIHGCLGCFACQRRPVEPGCVQKDDALEILADLVSSDLIVYATPLIAWDFSAQMKVMMDRQFSLVKNKGNGERESLLGGKQVVLLVTCAGPVDGNADLIQQIFEREMAFAGCKVVGKYILPGCSTPAQMGERGDQLAARIWDDVRQ